MKTLIMGISIVVLCAGLYGSALYACEKCSSSDRCDVATTSATPPAGCSLSPTEFSDRISEVGQIFVRHQAVRELDDGYAFQFPGDDIDLASRLTTWMVAERQCCSFFRFEMTFAAEQGPIWVSVAGPQDAKELVSSLLETAIKTK